jgi:hypothetical protein
MLAAEIRQLKAHLDASVLRAGNGREELEERIDRLEHTHLVHERMMCGLQKQADRLTTVWQEQKGIPPWED